MRADRRIPTARAVATPRGMNPGTGMTLDGGMRQHPAAAPRRRAARRSAPWGAGR